jgi:hypothetical protein
MVTAQNITVDEAGGGTSFGTASVTPKANKLYLLAVHNRCSSGTGNEPTVTGDGLTWVKVATSQNGASPEERQTLFRALGSSPTTGALTIDFAGQTQVYCSWYLNEFSNVDTTGTNGSGAIVQSNIVYQNSNTTGVTITLSAFGSPNNATFGCIGANGNPAWSVGTNFTQLGSGKHQVNEWANNPQTSVNFTWPLQTFDVWGIACEIKAGGAAGFFQFL